MLALKDPGRVCGRPGNKATQQMLAKRFIAINEVVCAVIYLSHRQHACDTVATLPANIAFSSDKKLHMMLSAIQVHVDTFSLTCMQSVVMLMVFGKWQQSMPAMVSTTPCTAG